MLEELPAFVILMLDLIDKVTKGEIGVNFSTSEQKRRYCNTLLKSSLSVLLLMIKNWRKSHIMQAKSFIHLLTDADCDVLLLRLIDVDTKSFIHQDDSNAEVL